MIESDSIKSSNVRLQSERRSLTSRVNELEARNSTLASELQKTSLASIDRTQVQALRNGVSKLTVSARKTKKLVAFFEAPGEVSDLSVKIYDPEGNQVDQGNAILSFQNSGEHDVLTASTAAVTPFAVHSGKTVQVVFVPEKRFYSGTYRLEVFNDGVYAGSMQVKLR